MNWFELLVTTNMLSGRSKRVRNVWNWMEYIGYWSLLTLLIYRVRTQIL